MAKKLGTILDRLCKLRATCTDRDNRTVLRNKARDFGGESFAVNRDREVGRIMLLAVGTHVPTAAAGAEHMLQRVDRHEFFVDSALSFVYAVC